ncbi:antitoxin [Alkanindiges illinoisensis]|uniref:AbrB/MazE/SpoVT family DNA-binding domain-containing protein n=1 Tax=Alkanindiges illinoisensis TaxID=197183 RepID=A0A4Y7XAK5_9GAMM|nr:type II toxin-antitoxin system VapB family antitoxin [Alkanindiges illinoisensis]TEU25009.1 AbrB/MazE/SpoVT family DNA-binding domain-containing protein [Alkanindiges illinoisensis]
MNHIARVFKSGNSQAVRLPKAFRVDVDELEIFQRGDELVLRRPASNLEQAFKILTDLPDDFFAEGREDLPLQEREDL